MIVVAIIIGVCIFGVMVYTALSKKTNFRLRIASLIALGLMILSIIICLIVALSGPVFVKSDDISSLLMPEPPPQQAGNTFMILFFIIFLLALFAFVLIMTMRERKSEKKSDTKQW